MKKLKVMTIVGTRPEIIKLSRVISKLEEHTEHVLVHTGQNFDFELNEVFFNELEVKKPDYFLEAAGSNPIETIAKVLVETDKLLEKIKPDALLVYGDTNSCLSVISAKKRKVPIFHMEAGNRCFDQRVPEEINRKIVDHLSDINMPLSEHARNYLISEGLPPERIIKTGSSMPEVLMHYSAKIEASKALQELKLTEKNYILVSLHREENVDYPENLNNLHESLNLLPKTFSKKVIVSTHPRTRKRLEEAGLKLDTAEIVFMKPFGFCDYIRLQKSAFCVVSDSGTITEEASILQFPAINVRNAHERPEGMDAGTVILAGTHPDDILNAVSTATTLAPGTPIDDYNPTDVSSHVVKIIMSYTHYVDRFVWRKTL
ncbi:MAG: UDP-N-acetylglucosamine 2-epimerase (non-hydrolyzing) [Bdellovibrionota bacterium]